MLKTKIKVNLSGLEKIRRNAEKLRRDGLKIEVKEEETQEQVNKRARDKVKEELLKI